MPALPFSLPFAAHSAPTRQHKRNLLLRIVDAIGETNRRRAEREIARFVARHGSQFPTTPADQH
jgi:hypothetical protein